MTDFPNTLAAFVVDNNFASLFVAAGILVLYLLLGCLMDSLAMILLIIQVFFPLIVTLEFGMSVEETAIWFGILPLIVVEVGLIYAATRPERLHYQQNGRQRPNLGDL